MSVTVIVCLCFVLFCLFVCVISLRTSLCVCVSLTGLVASAAGWVRHMFGNEEWESVRDSGATIGEYSCSCP